MKCLSRYIGRVYVTFLWLCIALFSGAEHARAQFEVWRHFDVAGISNTNIVSITEDGNGLLYLGTHGGVNIFDGRRFHPVEVPGIIEKGINPFVNQMRWGRNGLLWVCTRTHIYTYSSVDGGVNVLYGNGAVPAVGSIEVDTTRNILYFAYEDTLLVGPLCDTQVQVQQRLKVGDILESRLTPAGQLFLFVNRSKILKFDHGELSTVFEGAGLIDMDYVPASNQIVVMGVNGLVAIDCATSKTEVLPQRCTWPYALAKTRLTTLPGGRLLIQHGYGMDVFHNLHDTTRVRFRAIEGNTSSLRTDFVICAYEDRRGNLWVSEDGINLSVLPANAQGISYVSEKMAGATRLWASYHDKVGKQVFTGSEFGICRLRYSGDTPRFVRGIKPGKTRFFEPLGFRRWTEEEVLTLTNGQGSWLLNMRRQIFRLFEPLQKHSGSLNHYGALPMAGDKYLFYGQAGLFVFDRESGAFTEVPPKSRGKDGVQLTGVLAAMVDDKNRVWAADGHSIHVLDSGLNLLKTYSGKSGSNPSGLANTVVMDIRQTRSGEVYAATMGGGLVRLTAADTFEHIALTGNIESVFCIAELNDEYLVVTSGKGLIKLNRRTGQSCVLSEPYGMPVSDFNQLALAWDDSLLSVSGTKGYVVASKQAILNAFADTGHLLLMNGSLVLNAVTLQKGEENLVASVAIPGYLGVADWVVRYRLEGIDDRWRELGPGEWEIRYNSISPGSYTLRVEATDRNKVVFAHPMSVSVVALPYFWQTLWFRLLMLGIVLALLIGIVRFFSQLQLRWKLKKLEDEQKVARERIRISRELHDNVGSQLTYLISGLESSNLLLKKQDTQRLEQKLDKMQASARESMQQLRDSIWALNNETVSATVLISRFRHWLEHIMDAAPGMHYSVSDHVAVDVQIDPIRSLNIFRIMQEAVHNVLKHAHAHQLRIDYKCENNMLRVRIEDDGEGFDTSEREGNGRKTMAARASESGGTLELVSAPGKGTVITLLVAL